MEDYARTTRFPANGKFTPYLPLTVSRSLDMLLREPRWIYYD
jgi:hypothetical protein